MKNNIRIALVLTLVYGFASIQALSAYSRSNQVKVSIEPENQIAARNGQNVTIICKALQPLQTCRFVIPGVGSIHLFKGHASDDGIEYAGTSYEEGQCGVTIKAVNDIHDGNVTCALLPKEGRLESEASVRLVVAKAPNSIQIYLSQGLGGRDKYHRGEKMDVSCVADGGKPAADIKLYLGHEALGSDDDHLEKYYNNNFFHTSERNYLRQENRAEKNVSRIVDYEDNGKIVRCVAEHVALDRPFQVSREIEVFFAPIPRNDPVEQFGFVLGRQGRVNVTIDANPRPTFIWTIDGEKIHEGNLDDSQRLETSSAYEVAKGRWSAILTIDSVQKSDTEKKYLLSAMNTEGEATYEVVLSTSAEPTEFSEDSSLIFQVGAFNQLNEFYGRLNDQMHALGFEADAGSIIVVAITVLLLIVVVFITLFARATGRWCFAGASTKRPSGDASETESTGRFSKTETDTGKSGKKPKINLSHFFKRNKDKVTGADNDTVRTIMTIDDEKIPAADSNEAPGTDGGIVYAELDLTNPPQPLKPRLTDDKTEYAEILHTKAEEQSQPQQKK